MCSPHGVVKEFEDLKAEVERLAGSTGAAEYARLLRQHGVERPRQFRITQPVRLCAKDVYLLLEELRSNARENQREMEPDSERSTGGDRDDSTTGVIYDDGTGDDSNENLHHLRTGR